ncbi:class I SAM-dependent methyltransferase [Thermodesulfobacteriota bacterium]
MSVKEAFDKGAQSYDQARRQLVPSFDDFYGTVLRQIPYETQAEFRVLDLGAGSGILSFLVAKNFPKSRITLIDISQEMLDKAREKFTDSPNRFDFIVADYSIEELPGGFDVIISALSIHHNADSDKRRLFGKIYSSLLHRGLFINADQVLGSTAEIDDIYRKQWLMDVRKLGVCEADLAAAMERMREDKMATLEDQLQWLKIAGFQSVNCWYKNYGYTVFSGCKEDVQ